MPCQVACDELSRYQAGDLAAEAAERLREHVAACPACRERLERLRRLDAALARLGRGEPPPGTLLRSRRAVAQTLRVRERRELMTLDEVAAFLRIGLDDLAEIVLELPAFEVAGHVRVRRSRLIEWVAGRERAWSRSSAESEVAHLLSDAP
ncbi:MAG: zf-HC2 domain-containing protein [Candidatus Brocadiia bacterium]